jgi:aminodeoxychorismate synthase component I
VAVRELVAPGVPGRPCHLLGAFEALRADAYPWLLESTLADGRLGRFSFAGSDPYLVLRVSGERASFVRRREVGDGAPEQAAPKSGDPLELLRCLLPRTPAGALGADAPPFVGGAVGWLGYELGARLERVSVAPEDDLALPDLCFVLVDRVLALDHATGRMVAAGLGFGASDAEAGARAAGAADALADRVAGTSDGASAPPGIAAGVTPPRVGGRADASSYAKQVAAVKERIAAGDLYQACLTHRLEVSPAGDPWRLYQRLRAASPAPFAAFLPWPEAALVGSSPERFLRVDPGGRVESRPMKGTRARGATPDADARERRALARSAKDRAENVMIVDLVRNDLGRVCEIGSVAVPALCEIESYSAVHQMVSTVTGRLARGRDALDAVRAAFPPGSMTGAPKIAAMNLLARLEPLRRGPYAGALGYLDVRGGADLAVVIRTAVLRGGRAFLGVGGGVVADSVPEAEWRESLDKARALLRALGSPSSEA